MAFIQALSGEASSDVVIIGRGGFRFRQSFALGHPVQIHGKMQLPVCADLNYSSVAWPRNGGQGELTPRFAPRQVETTKIQNLFA